ncbi:hypothetical protein QN416_26255, partial [Glaciimonas sp. Cout2]|nr:hypothetical protein [Glaciimonas sp. Cout2]
PEAALTARYQVVHARSPRMPATQTEDDQLATQVTAGARRANLSEQPLTLVTARLRVRPAVSVHCAMTSPSASGPRGAAPLDT